MQKEMRTPKKKSKCIVCGFELSKPLFVLPNMPAGAQAMPDKAGLESDRGIELPLCRCPECGLYQFDCEPVDYYKAAIRVVGLSETMRNLRRSDYRHLIDDYGLINIDEKYEKLVHFIRNISINDLTPLEALNKLSKLQEMCNGKLYGYFEKVLL